MKAQKRWEIAQLHERTIISQIARHEKTKDVMRMLVARLEKDSRLHCYGQILDIGSGPPPTSVITYISEGEKVAIDPLMDSYVEGFDIPPNIRLLKGIGESLPFQGNTLNFVISTSALDHYYDPKMGLEEIYRILKREGILVLSVNCTGFLTTNLLKLRERLSRGDLLHAQHFSFISMTKMFRGLFKIIYSYAGRDTSLIYPYGSKKTRKNTWCSAIITRGRCNNSGERLHDSFLRSWIHLFTHQGSTFSSLRLKLLAAIFEFFLRSEQMLISLRESD